MYIYIYFICHMHQSTLCWRGIQHVHVLLPSVFSTSVLHREPAPAAEWTEPAVPRGGRQTKNISKNLGPGRMAKTPRADTGDFACRS